eukprot:g42953.t1
MTVPTVDKEEDSLIVTRVVLLCFGYTMNLTPSFTCSTATWKSCMQMTLAYLESENVLQIVVSTFIEAYESMDLTLNICKTVLDQANIPSIEALTILDQLRWAGQVVLGSKWQDKAENASVANTTDTTEAVEKEDSTEQQEKKKTDEAADQVDQTAAMLVDFVDCPPDNEE